MAVPKMVYEWRLGIDDTDSLEGGCTTHFMFNILKEFKHKIKLVEYPLLIRLNPNIPWKTRGNGAVGIRFLANEEQAINIFEYVKEMLPPPSKKLKRNSGAILAKAEVLKKEIDSIVRKALTSVVGLNEVLKMIQKKELLYHAKGNKRGLIGALSVCGYEFLGDFTYELLLYRSPENYGTKRSVSLESIKKLEKRFSPQIFSSYDFETNTPLILPRGKDPVLLGIRSKNAELLKKAVKTLDILEPVEGGLIFKTNQATDDHFKRLSKKELGFNNVFYSTVKVSKKPERMIGGHVRVLVKDIKNEEDFWVVAYEPSKRFRDIVSKLIPEDLLWVGGGIRDEMFENRYTLNLERLIILRTVNEYKKINPDCPICGKKLTSKGKNQGFKCKKCGKSYPDAKPKLIPIKRQVMPGLYLPPLTAQRHLTKPLERFCEYNEIKNSDLRHEKKEVLSQDFFIDKSYFY